MPQGSTAKIRASNVKLHANEERERERTPRRTTTSKSYYDTMLVMPKQLSLWLKLYFADRAAQKLRSNLRL